MTPFLPALIAALSAATSPTTARDTSSAMTDSVSLAALAATATPPTAPTPAAPARPNLQETLAKAPADLAAALDQLSAAAKRPSGVPPTLAVLPFQIAGGASPEAAAVASETAVLHLARDTGWKLVERARFQSILQEQALWGAGITSSELEIGRALEARYLLAGAVTTDGMRRLVAIRLIDAVDGRIVATGAARVDGPKMDDALKEALGEKFGVSGAVFRSISVPGWGQFWTERPVRGSLWLGATVGLAGALTWSVLDWADKDNASEDFKNRDASTFRPGESPDDWIARANAAIDDRNTAATRNLLIGSALAGTWLLNVADAAWCGARSARSARSRYFAFAPLVGPDAAGARLTIALGASR